jgi:hypothetical protein
VRLQGIRMLTLEPERLKNQLATTRKRSLEMEGLFGFGAARILYVVFAETTGHPNCLLLRALKRE